MKTTENIKTKENFLTHVKQINLKKKMTASKTYLKELKHNEIMLIQEPYIVRNRLCYKPKSHKSFIANSTENQRSVILLPIDLAKNTIFMDKFSNKDIVTVKCHLKNNKVHMLSSVYLQHLPNEPNIDETVLSKLSNAIKYSKENNIEHYIGIDTNGHHKSWGSMKNNRRGNLIKDFITTNDLVLQNTGQKPTFRDTKGGKSIIDLTLCNKAVKSEVKHWTVAEQSLSDHMMIEFDINMENLSYRFTRNIKDTDWNLYSNTVDELLKETPYKEMENGTSNDSINKSTIFMNKILIKALDKVCPMVKVITKSKTPWANELTKLKNELIAKKAKIHKGLTEQEK